MGSLLGPPAPPLDLTVAPLSLRSPPWDRAHPRSLHFRVAELPGMHVELAMRRIKSTATRSQPQSAALVARPR